MSERATVDWELVGTGTATDFDAAVEAELREVRGPADVLSVMEVLDSSDWVPPVILVHEAGGTTLGPLLGKIAGVVSTEGTLGAHIALLAKEYGCPCIVGARLTAAAEGLRRVRLTTDGSVWSASGAEGGPGEA
jgi:phosphohistidine swiveling domain-containing protein